MKPLVIVQLLALFLNSWEQVIEKILINISYYKSLTYQVKGYVLVFVFVSFPCAGGFLKGLQQSPVKVPSL